MRLLKSQGGLTAIELILAAGAMAFVLGWAVHPLQISGVAQNTLNWEMQQRQLALRLDPLVEDVRESMESSQQWSYLDTTTASYNPLNYPWFRIPSQANPGSVSYVCYYFDPAAQTLWRVETGTLPSNMVLCDPTVAVSTASIVATQLLPPSATQPIFSGDRSNQSIYFTLRLPTGSPGRGAGSLPPLLVASRFATPRN